MHDRGSPVTALVGAEPAVARRSAVTRTRGRGAPPNARNGHDAKARVSTVDGVKIYLPEGRVHLRTSNTEPIVCVYVEAETAEGADALAERFKQGLGSV